VNSSLPTALTRLGLAVLVTVHVMGFALAGAADGAPGSARGYLAPAGACPGSTDPAASLRVQEDAVRCLVNWARARHRQGRLTQSRPLHRAATLKGQGVVACREISHTPCGSDASATVRRAGYEYASFAENIYVGSLGAASAREVMAAWLQSPAHRENILRAGFRDFGTALVRADGVFYEGAAVVWIVEFASPR
jgi:uncharacterized protein YkwD